MKSDLRNYCLEIKRKLTDNNDERCKKEVIGLQLYDEIEIVLNFIDTSEIYSLEHVLEYIFKTNLTSTLPNLGIVLRIS